MKSHRDDGRGHWPKGRRRNDAPDLSTLRRRVLGALHRAIDAGEYSRAGVARRLKCSDRTIRRWLAGVHWPSGYLLKRARFLL